MAKLPARINLAKADDWLAVIQWVWERAFALVASTAGAAMLGYAAKATAWLAPYGPVAWAGIGLATFVLIYTMLVLGRARLAKARRDRAEAMIAERVAEHATVNPRAPDFRNQRIRLIDLYSPTGDFLVDKTFRDCDLIGPAVIWVSPVTGFRFNTSHNVEYVRINADAAQKWPNKLAFVGGSFERCNFINVIILVHDAYAANFETWFSDKIIWMNDAPNRVEGPSPPSPPDTGSETTP